MAANVISSAIIRMAVDTADLDTDLGRAARISDKRAKEIEKQFANIGKVVGAALVAGVTALAAGTSAAIKNMNDLADAAERIGLSAKKFTELKFAVEQSGGSVGALETGMRTLSKRIAEAAGGGSEAQKIFAAIGISATDAAGNIRPLDEVAVDVIDRFSKFDEGAGKTALALKFFGRTGTELAGTLKLTRGELTEFATEAARLGVVLSDEDAKATQNFVDDLDKLKLTLSGVWMQVAQQLLPALSSLVALFVEEGKAAVAAGNDTTVLADSFTFLLKVAVGVNTAFQVVGKTIGATIATIANNAGALGDIIKGRISNDLEQVARGVQKLNFTPAKELFVDIGEEIDKAGKRLAAIERPLKSVGATAQSAAVNFGKVKPPVVDLTGSAEKAANELQKLNEQMAKLEEKRVADALELEAREMKEYEEAAKQARVEFERFLDSFDNVDPVKVAISKLEIALEAARDPIKGNAKEAKELAAALDRVAQASLNAAAAAEKEAASRNAAMLLAGTTNALVDSIDGMAYALANGSEGWRDFGRQGVGALASVGAGMTALLKQGKSLTSLFIGKDGKPTEAFAALGGLFMTAAEASGGGWGGAALGAAGGALSGFQASAALGPYAWVGAVIGAIVGAYTGYGGGDKKPTLAASAGATAIRTEASLQTPLGRVNVGTNDMSNPTSRQVAEAIQDFDRTIVDILNTTQEGLARTAVATYNFRGDGGEASVGEALEARLELIATGVLGPVLGGFIKNFSNDFQTQLQAFNDLIQLDEMRKRGELIVDSLSDVTALVEKFGRAGETIGATYDRIARGVAVYNDALGLAEIAFDGTSLALATMAQTIIDEIGGIDKAARLFADAIKVLYTEAEIGAVEIAQAADNLARQLADVGLGPNASASDIRAGYEQALRSGDAVLIREYLEAAQALGILTQLQTQYTDAVEDTTSVLEDLTAAQRDYADFLVGIDRQIADLGASDFQIELRDVAEQFRENTTRANELARAAGLQGAREEDLARIHALAAGQAAAAIRALESASRDLVAQLYGDSLVTAADGAATAVNKVAAGVQALERAAQSFKEATLLDDTLSPLKVKDRYQEALRQLRATGDEGTGRIALQLARQLMASGGDYNAAFEMITGLVRPSGGGGGDSGGGDFTGGGQVTRTLDANARRGLAMDLAQNIADLAGAQGLTFAEVATNLGFTIDQLAQDLGLSNEALDTYLQTLQADSYSFEDLASLVTSQVDRIIAAIVGEVGVNVSATGRPLGGDPVKGEGPTPVVLDPEFVGKSEEQNAAVVERLESLESKLGQLLARIADNTEQTADTNQAMAKDARRPGPVRTTRSNPVVS